MVSTAVINTPAHSGSPNRRFIATADPITSAMSVAAMAISIMIHRTYTKYLGYASRHACAKSRSATIPSFRARDCRKMAVKFESKITDSNVYPNAAPPLRSVAQFPGSMYATLTMNPRPAKANAFLYHEPSGTSTEEFTSCNDATSLCRRHPDIRASSSGTTGQSGAYSALDSSSSFDGRTITTWPGSSCPLSMLKVSIVDVTGTTSPGEEAPGEDAFTSFVIVLLHTKNYNLDMTSNWQIHGYTLQRPKLGSD